VTTCKPALVAVAGMAGDVTTSAFGLRYLVVALTVPPGSPVICTIVLGTK
jgi:hypothetical protein